MDTALPEQNPPTHGQPSSPLSHPTGLREPLEAFRWWWPRSLTEIDASDFGIGSTMRRYGRLIAFFSGTSPPRHRHHSAIQKEAHATAESVRNRGHHFVRSAFTVITKQMSVSFKYTHVQTSKVNVSNVFCYTYDIIYIQGKDALSSVCCVSRQHSPNLQSTLCHLDENFPFEIRFVNPSVLSEPN